MSSTFTEFVGTRLSEVKISSDVRDWKWIPTDMNLADLGTRPNVTSEMLGPDTDFQCGMSWMRSPEESWLTKDNFSSPLQEESRKDLANVQVTKDKIDWHAKSNDLKKVVRYLAVVVAVVKKWIGYKVSAIKGSGGGDQRAFRYGRKPVDLTGFV